MPTIARIELTRPQMVRGDGRATTRRTSIRTARPLPGRTAVDTGFGFVIDGRAEVNLHEGPYEFRIFRGPEYRVINGNFTIEKTSEDESTLILPRILSMRQQGWTSGDCFVPPSLENLPIRMSAEDLHLAMVGNDAASVPTETTEQLRVRRQRKEQPDLSDPMFIGRGAESIAGLAFYHSNGSFDSAGDSETQPNTDPQLDAFRRIARLAHTRRENKQVAALNDDDDPSAVTSPQKTSSAPKTSPPGTLPAKMAIEDPFAWSLPVSLASGQVDGYFILGDWLRLDKATLQTKTGRPFSTASGRTPTTLGREAEQIYWETLNAGFRLAPLAGTGDEGTLHPVGYNRLYVGGPPEANASYDDPRQSPTPVTTEEEWWSRAWSGCSFATNGPLLQATIGGKLAGHVFETSSGIPLSLTPELTLTVRDPVDYLEVILNGKIHYSAKLDEYAKAGGKIPPLNIKESGWALIRVVTLYEGHFRAATTAPWYFDVDDQPRISRASVELFQKWLADFESHLTSQPNVDLAAYAPFIRATRSFWQSRLEQANAR
ncbi:CehA/McbA family metallohydrolase domain-containing protein [Aporhodopirellula aestuarii]|uniref:Uncharacterized protein n=1 Tax=Aporhodopirellula aestuarii TaxID=2950107 RepID=A0ABT0UAH3_9BACT|nr:hypothetical protein [Aporhodopirellula aestuarii]MCM2374008.1 hypothetical protein [Aporhodopirellula aestuarii]